MKKIDSLSLAKRGRAHCSDCPTAQWSCKSPIENSPSSTSAPAARGWDRLSQEIPLKDDGQLYRGRQARESGLTENFPLGRRELLMGRSDFHNSEGCGFSGALKNAIDFLFREWNDKVLEDGFAVSQAARG